MALGDVVYELRAVLGLDTKPYEEGLNDARDTAEKGGGGIKRALGTAAKVGGAALMAATGAAVAFGKSAVDAGMTFDSSMSQVAATMGYTVEELNDSNSEAAQTFETLGRFAQEMGASTAFSASEAADALNYMALAGYDAETSMEMLPNVLNLAAAGSIDLASASDMVTDAQSALGLTLPETTAMVDQMAAASSKSNTSVAQLGEAILTIGATARGVKGGTVELSTVLGVLADNGIKGAEGGTHLRNAILSLQTPTKDGTEALAKLGMTYEDMYDSAGNMRSLPEIFLQLQGAMEGMTQQSKDAIISGIFNKTDLAAINALVGTQKERWDELTESISESTGAAQDMANTQLDNLAGDITMFQSALEGAKIAISNGLTPSLRTFVQFGTESIQTLTKAFQEDGLAGALDALGPIIDQGIQMLFESLPRIIEVGASLLMSIIQGIINNLPKLIDAAVEVIFTLADGLIDALPVLIPAIVEVILTIAEKLTEPTMLMQLIQAAFQIIGAVAQGLIDAMPKIVETAPTIMMNLIEAILLFLPQLLASGIQLMSELALGITRGAVKVTEAIIKLLAEIPKKFKERIRDARSWGRDLIQNFIDGIKQKFASLKNSISSVANTVRRYLHFSEPDEGPLADFHTYAPDMMATFAKGIKDNEHLITDQISRSFDVGGLMQNTFGQQPNAATSVPPINITVLTEFDGEVLSRKTYKYNQKEIARHGMSLINA